MKHIKFSLLTLVFLSFAAFASAQTKSEQFQVSGACGMCKKSIEKAAKTAGATAAEWNKSTQVLTVSYDAAATSTAKIQEAIAKVGYDNPGFKATNEAYEKLDPCCQYERTAQKAAHECGGEKCTHEKCNHEGKCSPDMSCCKDSGCDKKDCCKKG